MYEGKVRGRWVDGWVMDGKKKKEGKMMDDRRKE